MGFYISLIIFEIYIQKKSARILVELVLQEVHFVVQANAEVVAVPIALIDLEAEENVVVVLFPKHVDLQVKELLVAS